MLEKIYRQRYGKLLLGVCVVLTLIYLGIGWVAQHSWHEQKDYYESEEFLKDFRNNPDYYIKHYNEENPTYYLSAEEYKNTNLLIYNSSVISNNRYDVISSKFNISGSKYTFSLLFLLGFLSFFIDQKTNFNRFLFSLPFNRRTIFQKKIIFLLTPVSLALTIGILANIFIRYLMIPHEYFQIPVFSLLASGVSHFIVSMVIIAFGVLLGVILGNILWGLISLGIIFMLMSRFYDFLYNLQEFLSFLFLGNGDRLIFSNLWSEWPDGVPVSTGAGIGALVIFLGLILAAQEAFNNISLENDDDYLTIPTIRKPVFFVLGISVWFYLVNLNGMLVSLYYKNPSEKRTIVFLFIYLILCLMINFVLIYFKVIKNLWHSRGSI